MTKTTRRRPVRYGVVGLGHIAQVAVLPGFAVGRFDVVQMMWLLASKGRTAAMVAAGAFE